MSRFLTPLIASSLLLALCTAVPPKTVLAETMAAPQTPPPPASSSPTPPVQTGMDSIPFIRKTVTTNTGTYPCQVFVPKKWTRRKSWPVILFLHGSGERGSDGLLQTKNGVRRLIGQDTDGFPCVVVCPQCAKDISWTSPDMMAVALKAVNDAIEEYHGDKRRVYLTGLSMGGYGTWALAKLLPGKWAAIAPVCGGVADRKRLEREKELKIPSPDFYREEAEKITSLPIWVFHGAADPTVPVSESRQMVGVLYSLKADVRYNEYPGVKHNSWDFAYAEPGLLPWLLSHKLENDPVIETLPPTP